MEYHTYCMRQRKYYGLNTAIATRCHDRVLLVLSTFPFERVQLVIRPWGYKEGFHLASTTIRLCPGSLQPVPHPRPNLTR